VWSRKGALVVGEAARIFLREFPDLHMVFAGRVDPSEKADERIVETLGRDLATRCHFLGHLGRAEALALMGKARAFLFPSTLETFGLAAAEAMLQGCPTIVSNMPPFTEFVSHNETGILVDPGRPDELASAVASVMRDDSLRARLSRNGGRAVAERFSLQSALSQTLDFYHLCLNEPPNGRQVLA